MIGKNSIPTFLALIALGILLSGNPAVAQGFIVGPNGNSGIIYSPGWGNNFNRGSYFPYPSYSPTVYGNPYFSGGPGNYYRGIFGANLTLFPNYTGYAPLNLPGWETNGGSGASARMRTSGYPAVGVAADSPLLAVGSSTGENRANVVITVPEANAQVWVEGTLTNLTGLNRRFVTPPLLPGSEYTYDIRAQWTDAQGQVRSATKSVTFRTGDEIPVIFGQ